MAIRKIAQDDGALTVNRQVKDRDEFAPVGATGRRKAQMELRALRARC